MRSAPSRLAAFAAVTLALACSVLVAASAEGRAGGALGARGYLFVADYDKHVVRRYDAETGESVDTFVPKHSAGLKEPQFLLIGPHDHDLYVGSGHFGGPLHAVLRFDGTDGSPVGDGEFTESDVIESTHGVIFGPDGNLYVGDWLHSNGGLGQPIGGRILRFDGITGAYMDDFVPAGAGSLWHPFGMSFGPRPGAPDKLDLYVCNAIQGNNILRFDGTTGEFLGVYVAAGSGGLQLPSSATFGPDGNLYVASFQNQAVMRYQGPAGGNPGAPMPSAGNSGAIFVPTNSGGLLATGAVLFGPDGNADGREDLYVSSAEFTGGGADKAHHGSVKRYDGTTGAFIGTFVEVGSGGLDNAYGLTFSATDPVTLAYVGE